MIHLYRMLSGLFVVSFFIGFLSLMFNFPAVVLTILVVIFLYGIGLLFLPGKYR